MDSLQIARARLAGWSMGGNEITAMAGSYPDRVDRIVYLDAAYDWADPRERVAFKALPFDLSPKPANLASPDAFKAWEVATFYPSVGNPDQIEVARVRGAHGDFLWTSTGQVAEAMRKFLVPH